MDADRIGCLAEKLVGVGPGNVDRPRYLDITEGRESSMKPKFYYGWCGDLATYVCELAGCTAGTILNRARLNRGKWTPQDNLTRLTRWAKAAGAWYPLKDAKAIVLQKGWLYIRSRSDGDHIGVVIERTSTGIVRSIDGNSYGNIVGRNHWTETSIIQGYINTSLLPTTEDTASNSSTRRFQSMLVDVNAALPPPTTDAPGDGTELEEELLA